MVKRYLDCAVINAVHEFLVGLHAANRTMEQARRLETLNEWYNKIYGPLTESLSAQEAQGAQGKDRTGALLRDRIDRASRPYFRRRE